jgi:hypothetical protein
MDYKKREEFVGLHIQVRPAVAALNIQAEEVIRVSRKDSILEEPGG